MKALTKCKSEIDSQGRKVLRFTPTEWEALESKMDALEASHKELVEALRVVLGRLKEYGEWDDGCFYYNRTSCSELEMPMEKAETALANAEKIAK